MSRNRETSPPESFEEMYDRIWMDLKEFITYVNQKSSCDTVTLQLYFELKTRLKHAENLWDMYVSSFKQIKDEASAPIVLKNDKDRYFSAVGRAKMFIYQFATDNKLSELKPVKNSWT